MVKASLQRPFPRLVFRNKDSRSNPRPRFYDGPSPESSRIATTASIAPAAELFQGGRNSTQGRSPAIPVAVYRTALRSRQLSSCPGSQILCDPTWIGIKRGLLDDALV